MKKADFEKISESERMNRVLTGTSYYASVHSPNFSAAKKFGADPAFMVTLGLDDEGVKQAKNYGLKVRPADDFIPMPHVKIQRKIKDGKTPDSVKPQVVDSMQQKVPASIMIGNTSKVTVKFGTYWYETGGGGVGTTLFKVQIRELVKYENTKDRNLAMDEGGFKIEANAVEQASDNNNETEFDQ